MSIRCDLCGYENGETYRFCGMCGAALRHPEPTRETVRQSSRSEASTEKPIPVTGPSFLGLSQEPEKAGVEYLLEDEEPRRHVGTVLVIILLAAAAAAAWYWRASYTPYIAKLMPQVSNAPVNGVAAQGNASAPTVPSVGSGVTTSPEPSQPLAPTQAASPADNSQAPPPATADESHTVQTDQLVAAVPQKPAHAQGDNSETKGASPETPTAAAANQRPTPTKSAAETTDETGNGSGKETEADSDSAASATVPVPTRKAKPAPASQSPTATAPAMTTEDRLVADGRKYLYGDGVPENCDRARHNLTTAAGHNNPQAQSILGTMYATGHCVNRDLPTAYRWFARALHTEPSNDRVKQDLEVLWRQMTPDERQMAIRSQ